MGGEDDQLVDWLEAAREGDERALSRLLEHLRPRIEAYLRQRLDSNPAPDALAEELSQEVLIRIADGLDDCWADTPARLRGWVRTIARRVSVDWYRKREPELGRRAWEDLTDVSADVLEAALFAADDASDPGPAISEADRVLGRLLLKAQAVLSEGTQKIVRRRLLYGDTWAEAGRAIGTTEGGAKRRW